MNRYYIYYGIAAMLLLEAFILYFKKCYKKSNRYYATAYQKRLLLTKYEWKNYMSTRGFLESQGLYICPKCVCWTWWSLSGEWGILSNASEQGAEQAYGFYYV